MTVGSRRMIQRLPTARGVMRFAVALLIAAVANSGAQNAHSRFGLVAGRVYSYSGTARWTDSTQRVHSSPVRWRMDVLQVRASAAARAALVRGWIQDLAWYSPGQRQQLTVLLEIRGALYQLAVGDSAAAIDTLIDAVRDASAAARRSQLVIDSALVVGRLYGQEADRGDRNDDMYAWLVESKGRLSNRPGWLSLATDPTQWQLVYRTLPDDQLLDFVPGVGITRFVYTHHGTVATTDVHLSTVTSRR